MGLFYQASPAAPYGMSWTNNVPPPQGFGEAVWMGPRHAWFLPVLHAVLQTQTAESGRDRAKQG